MIRSLETRLLLAVSLLASAAVGAVAIATRQGARGEFQRFRELESRTASERIRQSAHRLAPALDGRCCPDGWAGEVAGQLGEDEILLVLGPNGVVAKLGRPLETLVRLEAHRIRGVLVIEAERARGPARELLSLRLLDRGVPLRLHDGGDATLHLVPLPRDDEERHAAAFLGSLDQRLLGVTVLVAMGAVGLTALIARRIVRPVRELSGALRDFATGDTARRVSVRGSGEVADLGRRFNEMAAELDRQQTLRRGLVHDVAHELRTPLTALRCRIEALADGLAPEPTRAYADMRDDVLHLGQLVDDLQEMALAEARELRLDFQHVLVEPLVRSAAGAAGLRDDPRLRLALTGGLAMRADPVRVRQALLNLLTNADRHTPAGGTILVRSFASDSEIAVEVENTGSRLTEEQLERIFDRFYRTDPARQRATGGSGLGLAIVKSLVEVHGGRVWARSDEAGVTVGFAVPASRSTLPE